MPATRQPCRSQSCTRTHTHTHARAHTLTHAHTHARLCPCFIFPYTPHIATRWGTWPQGTPEPHNRIPRKSSVSNPEFSNPGKQSHYFHGVPDGPLPGPVQGGQENGSLFPGILTQRRCTEYTGMNTQRRLQMNPNMRTRFPEVAKEKESNYGHSAGAQGTRLNAGRGHGHRAWGW